MVLSATGSVAIVLVSGYQMASGAVPYGMFACDRDGRKVRVYDPASVRHDQGMAAATEADAASEVAYARMIHSDRDRLGAAIIRKGPLQ
jgi:hypothetical protein